MKKLKKVLLLSIALIFLLLPQLARADGAPFPPSNKYVTETDQKAVIIHENNTETIVLSVTFKGDPENFGWVIPIPSKPEVEKSQDELFTALAELTAPVSEGEYLPTFGLGGETAVKEPLKVDIIETKKIDIYDITTITSEDPKALSKWLLENEYQIPKEASTILEEYTKNDWYFICVKIDLTKLTSASKEQLKTGHATPLKIQFESEEIIYPLKLSSIISEYESLSPDASSSSAGLTPVPQVSILLYVFSDGKKTVPGFETKYANWTEKETIEDLAINSEGENWYKPKSSKLYLTKFYRSMKTSEMTSDLIFRAAEDNEPIGITQSNTIYDILAAIIVFALVFIIILLSPMGLIFIVLTLVQFLTKSKAAHIVCWVFQSLFLLITILIALILSLMSLNVSFSPYFSESVGVTVHFDWVNIAVMAAAIAVVLVEILVIIWQIKYQRAHPLEEKEDNPEEAADNMFGSKKETGKGDTATEQAAETEQQETETEQQAETGQNTEQTEQANGQVAETEQQQTKTEQEPEQEPEQETEQATEQTTETEQKTEKK